MKDRIIPCNQCLVLVRCLNRNHLECKSLYEYIHEEPPDNTPYDPNHLRLDNDSLIEFYKVYNRYIKSILKHGVHRSYRISLSTFKVQFGVHR